MSKYGKLYNPHTPQSQPMEAGQVKNNAGGYVFTVSPWTRLHRYLVLGSENPTYYQRANALTKENAKCVMECWNLDPLRTAAIITSISDQGRAPKNDPAIFALALGAVSNSKEARQAAYAAVPVVCRTASHLFSWQSDCSNLGKGSGRGYKRVLANWYGSKTTKDLAFQMVKYRQRNGFTHKRAIELSNMGPGDIADLERVNLYKWARGKHLDAEGNWNIGHLPDMLNGHLAAMTLEPKDASRLANLIERHKLPWEAIPTWAMKNKEVWETLIPTVGLTALIRNLGNITACGAVTSQNYETITNRLLDTKALDKARIHPFNVLQALAVYRSGKGLMGDNTWTPVTKIIDALDEAFYYCFKFAEPTGKRYLVALDVSGSMDSPIGSPSTKLGRYTSSATSNPLSCREASAAMALVTLKTERHVDVIGFSAGSGSFAPGNRRSFSYLSTGVTPLNISARQRLDDVVKTITGLRFGGTDCALPMLWALDKGHKYDAIVVYTDNETWAGNVHPKQALDDYKRKMDVDTKFVVCGMTSTGFSIADPLRDDMLDIVGLDSAVPTLISNFLTGNKEPHSND